MRRSGTLLVAVVAALVTLTGSPSWAVVPDPADDPLKVTLSSLRPTTGKAAGDRPAVYSLGCHVSATQVTPTHCTLGDRDGTKLVVAIGDSHMANWAGAVDAAARAQGWRLVWMTKSACPGQDVTISMSGKPYTACDEWRRRVFAKIRAMSRVDMVVLAGSSRSVVLQRGTLRALTDPQERQVAWRNGTLRTFDALAGEARRVLVLRDTPAMGLDVPSCLVEHYGWTRLCSKARSTALEPLSWAAEKEAASTYPWARATELTDSICATDACRPVTSSSVLRWRDRHHLTHTFSKVLAPVMRAKLVWHMR